MSKTAFEVRFNNGKQWVDVFISEDSETFKKENDCQAWYIGAEKRKVYSGLFGSMHFSMMDDSPEGIELMTHEIDHLVADWMRSRRITLSERNEERIATLKGDISKNFWEAWKKWRTE